jgi:hypothetical protein
MRFPNSPAPVVSEHPVTVGEGTVTFLIQPPNTAQRFEDEDNGLRCEEIRLGRLRACVVGWKGLEDDHGPVGYSIYKLQTLCDAYPETLDALIDIVDRLFE